MTGKSEGINQEDARLVPRLSTTSSTALATSAGRGLDALVAEKVMGFSWRAFPNGRALKPSHSPAPIADKFVQLHPHEWGLAAVPYYSTNIADAWLIVEKVDNRNAVAKEMGVLTLSLTRYDNSYTARFFNSGATAETAPLAICLAALKAVGG